MKEEEEVSLQKNLIKNFKILFKKVDSSNNFDTTSELFLNIRKLVKNHKCHVETVVITILELAKNATYKRRLFLLYVIDYFFLRSHDFRQCLLLNSKTFTDVFLETDPLNVSIKGTKNERKQLQIETIKIINIWDTKFEKQYIRLNLLIERLKTSKHWLDLENISHEEVVNSAKSGTIECVKKRRDTINIHMTIIQNRFSEIKNTCNQSLTEMFSVMQLLVSPTQISCSDDQLIDFETTIKANEDNKDLINYFIETKMILVESIAKFTRLLETKKLKTHRPSLSKQISDYQSVLYQKLDIANKIKIENYQLRNKVYLEDVDDFVDVSIPNSSDLSADDILMKLLYRQSCF